MEEPAAGQVPQKPLHADRVFDSHQAHRGLNTQEGHLTILIKCRAMLLALPLLPDLVPSSALDLPWCCPRGAS